MFDAVFEFFFPSHCFFCGRMVKSGVICPDCFQKIERTGRACPVCGQREEDCDCSRFVYHFTGMTAPFLNIPGGIAQTGVYRMKFSGLTAVAPFFGAEMAERVQKAFPGVHFDGVVAVPSDPVTRWLRGYNQAQLLAEIVAEKLGVPFLSGILSRRLFSKKQHHLSNGKKRFSNVADKYIGKNPVCGTVLLVDDIKTSGATLDQCARCLLYAGAREVYCVTALVFKKQKRPLEKAAAVRYNKKGKTKKESTVKQDGNRDRN